MDMKWNPIIDGDFSKVPIDESLLVTGIDNGELYVEFGYIESLHGNKHVRCRGLPHMHKDVRLLVR